MEKLESKHYKNIGTGQEKATKSERSLSLQTYTIQKFERLDKNKVIIDISNIRGEGRIRLKYISRDGNRPKLNVYSHDSIKNPERKKTLLLETRLEEKISLNSLNSEILEKSRQIVSLHELVEKARDFDRRVTKELRA